MNTLKLPSRDEIHTALYDQPMAEATIIAACQETVERVKPVQADVKEHLITTTDPAHFDETSMRVEGKLCWIHVVSTQSYTWPIRKSGMSLVPRLLLHYQSTETSRR